MTQVRRNKHRIDKKVSNSNSCDDEDGSRKHLEFIKSNKLHKKNLLRMANERKNIQICN